MFLFFYVVTFVLVTAGLSHMFYHDAYPKKELTMASLMLAMLFGLIPFVNWIVLGALCVYHFLNAEPVQKFFSKKIV